MSNNIKVYILKKSSEHCLRKWKECIDKSVEHNINSEYAKGRRAIKRGGKYFDRHLKLELRLKGKA